MKPITILNDEYLTWLKTLCERYRSSQIKAAIRVNQEMLRFYWFLGEDISKKEVENKYGSSFYITLSRDLKKMMPDATGLSASSIRYAKRFYELYSNAFENLQQVAENSLPPIFNIPWGHHMVLIDRFSDSPEKALFFVNQIIANGWSRDVLRNFIDTDLYDRQGKAMTNFSRTIPEIGSDVAKELTKDPYNFAFTGITARYNEKLLKDALLNNITQFLI